MISEQPFFTAVEQGDADQLAQHLDRSPALANARNDAGQSAVLVAAYRGHRHVVALLRERGATLDVFDAAAVGDVDRLETLLAHAPELLRTRSSDGWTPLHLACFFGQTDAAHSLLDAGADVRAWSENATRNTPLHAALAGVRDPALIQRLLEAGADVDARAAGGVTPLHLAAARGDLVLIDALLKLGAQATRTDGGQSPAEIAAERGHPEAAHRLNDPA